MDEKVEQTEEELTSEQDSPTVEENDLEQEDSDTAEKPEETPEEPKEDAPEDKNWRAVREELDRLKAENKQLKGDEEAPKMRSELDNLYLTNEENIALQKEEVKAELKYPELEKEGAFTDAVYGKYRRALDDYTLKRSLGQKAVLPSVYGIASNVKTEMDKTYGSVSKKAEVEGAKKAKQSKADREATVDAEGRSDRARVAKESSELSELQVKTRKGDLDALAERLSRSKL